MKTWKDFHCNCKPEDEYCPLIEIQDAAREWVKKLKNPDKEYNAFYTGLTEKHISGAIMFIKYFFNLEDEE